MRQKSCGIVCVGLAPAETAALFWNISPSSSCSAEHLLSGAEALQLSTDDLHELQREQTRDPTNGSENVNTDPRPPRCPSASPAPRSICRTGCLLRTPPHTKWAPAPRISSRSA